MLPEGLRNKIFNAIKTDTDGHSSFGTIDYLHNKVHEGKMLFVTKVVTVANGANYYIRHISGANKYMHSQIEVDSIGAWRFTDYLDTTYTADGVEIEQVNRKTDSTYVPEVKFYEQVVGNIDVLGTQRLDFAFGSGTNPAKATSGSGGDRIESVFAPNTDLLVKLTNNSGSEQLLTIKFNYYEEE